jgi:hypothetical protein
VRGDEQLAQEVLVDRKWREVAAIIEHLNDLASDHPNAFAVDPGSSLGSDDRASGPFCVSVVLNSCLNAGIDHLHALKSLILDAGLLHLSAPFSLARGGLENFAAATWVLAGHSRDERVERALRWHAQNVKDGHRALGAVDIRGSRPLAAQWALLDEVADRHNLGRSYRAGYTSSRAVQAAEAAFPDLRLGVAFPWQLCSGFAHGRPWAFHGASQRDELEDADPLMVTLRLSATLSTVLHPTLAAVELVQSFLLLYDERASLT